MRHDLEHKNALHLVTHAGNQTVMIASDIEDGTVAHRISVPEIRARLDERSPRRPFRDAIPIEQWLFRIRVLFPKLSQSSFADDAQAGNRSFAQGSVILSNPRASVNDTNEHGYYQTTVPPCRYRP
jgi:hypothetical protein